MLTVSRIALMIIIALLSITASAIYFSATRERIPIYNPVSFLELDYANTSFGGVSMKPPVNITSALKPLPLIFIVRREWHGASNVADYGASFWTILKRREVIRFGFNATDPVDMDFVSIPSGDRVMHTKGASSYNGTFMVASGGLYAFDFSVADSLEKSVNAVISFRCLGATNLEAVKSQQNVSVYTTVVQVNATRQDSPWVAPLGESSPDAINTSTQFYGPLALLILVIASFSAYLIRLHQHRAKTNLNYSDHI